MSTSYLNTEGSDIYVDIGPGEQRDVALNATRGVDLRGVVVDESGAALSGGMVTVVGLDRQSVSDGTFPVAEDGTFLITGLMPGAGYQVVWQEDPPVRSNLAQEFQGRVGLRTGRTAEVTLTGEIPESLRIVFTSK